MKKRILISFVILFCIMIMPIGVDAKERLGTCRYIVRDTDLQLDGFSVEEARDGDEALDKFQQEQFDLVIMDRDFNLVETIIGGKFVREKK